MYLNVFLAESVSQRCHLVFLCRPPQFTVCTTATFTIKLMQLKTPAYFSCKSSPAPMSSEELVVLARIFISDVLFTDEFYHIRRWSWESTRYISSSHKLVQLPPPKPYPQCLCIGFFCSWYFVISLSVLWLATSQFLGWKACSTETVIDRFIPSVFRNLRTTLEMLY